MILKRFLAGFGFIFSGRKVLAQIPGAYKWIIAPYFIIFVLLGGGVIFGTAGLKYFVGHAMTFVFGNGDTLILSAVYYVTLILFWLVFLTIYFYVIYLVVSVIASPFYSILAEKVLVQLNVIADKPQSFRSRLKLSLHMLWVSFLRGIFLLFVGVGLFVVSFIPGLNLFAAYAAFVILALDSADYGFEVLGYNLRRRMAFFRENLAEFLGMAAFLALTGFVPGLILLVMPFAVAGAATFLKKGSQ